jgi:Mn-containing catalase
LPGIEKFANLYVNTSQGEGDENGPWNSGDQWVRIDDLEQTMPIDGGDGTATVGLDPKAAKSAEKLASRTASNASSNPETGVDLGAGPGAGLITGEDLGGAADVVDAAQMANAI